MRPTRFLITGLSLASLTALGTLSGCEEKTTPTPTPTPAPAPAPKSANSHGHEHGPNGEHLAPVPNPLPAPTSTNSHGHEHGPNGEHFAPYPAHLPPTAPKSTNSHGHAHGPNGEHLAPAPAPTKTNNPGHGSAVITLGEQSIASFTAKANRGNGQLVPGNALAFNVILTPTAGSTTKAVAVRFWIGAQDAKGSIKAKAEIEDPKGDPNRWHAHAEVPNPLPAGSKLWAEIEDDKGVRSLTSFELKS
jgi:hypothetical protein